MTEEVQNLLELCIEELFKEHGTTAKAQGAPLTFTTFRALVNVREPKPASPLFLAAQDKLLSSVIKDAGVTEVDSIAPSKCNPRLSVWRGDICTLKVDAIVNAANNKLLGCFVPGHNCIDNAIHTFAGVQLRAECNRIMRNQDHDEPTGRAKITSAFNLPCRYVLHTVGPIIMAGVSPRDEELLRSCYISCLDLAEAYGLHSVAFCCISTGVFGYPQERAARTAVEAVQSWFDQRDSALPEGETGNVARVIFDTFSLADTQIYEALLV